MTDEFIDAKDAIIKEAMSQVLDDIEWLEDAWDSFGFLVKAKTPEEVMDGLRGISWDAVSASKVVNKVIKDEKIKSQMLSHIIETSNMWDT